MRLYNYTEESRQDSLYILDVPYMEYEDEESHVKNSQTVNPNRNGWSEENESEERYWV